jgi:8-oxo-dGTP diphosphatase
MPSKKPSLATKTADSSPAVSAAHPVTTASLPVVQAGLAVFIWRDGKFLMFRRKGSHASGTWSIPGGHIEFGESWDETAAREAYEETGVTLKNIRYFITTNDIMPNDNKHYITIWMEAELDKGEPQNMEPHKADRLEWHTFHDMPQPLFEPCWSNLRALRPELFA